MSNKSAQAKRIKSEQGENTAASTLVYDIDQRRYINIGKYCTLACEFCPKTMGDPIVHDYYLGLEKQPDAQDIISQLPYDPNIEEYVFCGYSEPTLRLKPLIQIAEHIKAMGGKVRINTDGLANLAHKKNVLPELAQVADALSISLNAQNKTVYDKHCKPGIPGAYEALIEFIELAPAYISDVTITAIKGLEGVDIEACKAIAAQYGVKFRQRELDIVG
jgi:TatD family-associated radical SAM protein